MQTAKEAKRDLSTDVVEHPLFVGGAEHQFNCILESRNSKASTLSAVNAMRRHHTKYEVVIGP